MMHLPGVNATGRQAYLEHIVGPHEFDIEVDVLRMDEKVAGSITPQFKDGQVNVHRDATIRRTATLTFFDPDRALQLDKDSPFEGALFADRMIRVRHVVDVPGVGVVTATPFVGPATRISRKGDDLTVECQDKTVLAVEGTRPKTVRKGRNAVDAIKAIMRDCTGESRFRFPQGTRKRLSKAYNVGWKEQASPWRVCQKIAADELDMQLGYACDGALLLRRRPTAPALTIQRSWLTGTIDTDQDISALRNYVRVTGDRKKKVAAVAKPGDNHSLSPLSLGRNGVPRFLPMLISAPGLKKDRDAQERADRELARNLRIPVTSTMPLVPFFHLDHGDLVDVETDDGTARVVFAEASLPLGVNGDAELGSLRRVSRPRRVA